MIKYYLTQRPPMPGAFPGKPVNMKAYDERTYVSEIGKRAWGLGRIPVAINREGSR